MAHFSVVLIGMAEKCTIMAHYFLKQKPEEGAYKRTRGYPERDNEYLGGEHGKNDKSDNSGTDEGTLFY